MLLALLLFTASGGAPAHAAGIQYDAGADTLYVIDYPEHSPCTPARLRAADARFGWNRVDHDAATDTTTVKARLIIGANDGSDTYFQVGSPERPREALVMHNDLYIVPHWVKGLNHGERWWTDAPRETANRLTLGVSGRPDIRARLVFAGEAALRAGSWPALGNVERFGGQIFVHHGELAAESPGELLPVTRLPEGQGLSFSGASYHIEGATITGFNGFMTRGLQYYRPGARFAHLTDTVFADGGAGLLNGQQRALGCTFRNLTVAVMDYGSLDAELTDCVFENNRHNWALTHGARGLTLIDCTYDKPAEGNLYRRYLNPRTGKEQIPRLTVKRHIILAVMDSEGRAIQDAGVRVRNEQDVFAAVEPARPQAVARIAGQPGAEAWLLTEYIKEAGEVENAPERTDYSYTIEVTAEGFHPARRVEFRPQTSWERIEIALEKR